LKKIVELERETKRIKPDPATLHVTRLICGIPFQEGNSF